MEALTLIASGRVIRSREILCTDQVPKYLPGMSQGCWKSELNLITCMQSAI